MARLFKNNARAAQMAETLLSKILKMKVQAKVVTLAAPLSASEACRGGTSST